MDVPATTGQIGVLLGVAAVLTAHMPPDAQDEVRAFLQAMMAQRVPGDPYSVGMADAAEQMILRISRAAEQAR